MKYKVYLEQDNGCDYTIACGKKVRDLTSTNIDDATNEASNLIMEEYSYDEGKLAKATVFEVAREVQMNVIEICKRKDAMQHQEVELIKKHEELAELARLKAKYPNS